MPLNDYGVLAARAIERRREGDSVPTPHYQIHLRDDSGVDYRVAVNVKSQQTPSDLLYLVDADFRHPLTQLLPEAGSGWTREPSQPGTASLDFIRGNLFDPALMRTLPPDLPGADNDLEDLIDHYVQRAIDEPAACIYAFGQRWPTEQLSDKALGFGARSGVHDIHMNQGNSGQWVADDGVWQDGGLLIRLPSENRWVAVFLAFQSQSWHTDDGTGHALAPVRPITPGQEQVRIVAAVPNPATSAPATVTLLNASPAPVNLQGWRLGDQHMNLLPLPEEQLQPGETLRISAEQDGFRLGADGGAITLLDPSNFKVHGVAYTKRPANSAGSSITF
ncbi:MULTISPECIES: DUF2278 family protein [Kitasatospora]|uniref:LTD domain-containing protein n=1 Tax=Kitasatospora cystarginea TaxID=58350 RepID=A0ABN3EV91_9ACTN